MKGKHVKELQALEVLIFTHKFWMNIWFCTLKLHINSVFVYL